MMSERNDLSRVGSLVSKWEQVTQAEGDDSANCWSGVRYNANNGWYVNATNGIVNNNNSINRYRVVPCRSVELLYHKILDAEADCYRNKHHSMEAAKVHYHLASLYSLAEELESKTYKPQPSRCFVVDYPVPREIFCAVYRDRVVHHYFTPSLIELSEQRHTANGNVSHGNRKGCSAYTAACMAQKLMRSRSENWTRECWVATVDFKGYFMSLPKDKVAESVFSLDGDKRELVLDYLKQDVTKDCERRSPISAWGKVGKGKSLFTAKDGCGLPIGNYPSQILANLYRAKIDEAITRESGVGYVAFVDDLLLCGNLEQVQKGIEIAERVSREMGLTLHPRKRYIQRVDHGVRFCGYVIKCDRIYIGNRVVRACEYVAATETDESALCRRLNSYFGLMAHCRSWNIQKRIAKLVLNRCSGLYFQKRGSQLVCRMKNHKNKYNYETWKNGWQRHAAG